VDIQSATAEIRRGKKKTDRQKIEEETTGQKNSVLPYGSHNELSLYTALRLLAHVALDMLHLVQPAELP